MGYTIESLEERLLLANLRLTEAFLVDNAGRAPNVAVGGMQYVRVEWQTTDLAAGTNYDLRVTAAGKTITRPFNFGAGNAGTGGWVWHLGPFPIRDASPVTVTATLDPLGALAETNEGDNARTAAAVPTTVFGPKFGAFLEGTPFVDWSIGNYVDLSGGGDGTVLDYRGGRFGYDGHNGWDIGPAHWRAGDAGIDVYAAAAGTVVGAEDGHFDRNTEALGQPSNVVTIDHGGGWRTIYHHLLRDSVSVSVGQQVAAGQVVGKMGSSGNSTALHLHWQVTYRGELVEPALDNRYFLDPLPYTGERPTILDAGVTSYDPLDELFEGPTFANVAAPGQTVSYWFAAAGIETGDNFQIRWTRPNGTLYTTFNRVLNSRGSYYFFFQVPSDAQTPGTWSVETWINGQRQAASAKTFTVQAAGVPQVRLYRGSQYVIDGRTTPFSLGTVNHGQATTPIQFRVMNSGAAPLTTGNLTVPAGFAVVDPLAATIAPGAVDTFSVRLDASVPGAKAGVVSFATNDAGPGEDLITFRVEGVVRTPPAVTGVVVGDGVQWTSVRRIVVAFDRPGITAEAGAFVLTPRGGTPLNLTVTPGSTDGPATYVLTFSGPGVTDDGSLADGDYNLRVVASRVVDSDGQAMAADFAHDFHVLRGDVNRDRLVNGTDFAILAANFGKTGMTYDKGDLNGDAAVNGTDFALLAANFGRSLPSPAAAAAPAPAAAAAVATRPAHPPAKPGPQRKPVAGAASSRQARRIPTRTPVDSPTARAVHI